MGIHNKIEEIRRKPEHVRLRYVWFFVALSMIFVVIVWMFSWKVQMNQASNKSDNPLPTNALNQLNEEASNLKNGMNEIKKTIEEQKKSSEGFGK